MFAPENMPFWLGFAAGVVVAFVIAAVVGIMTEPRAKPDPYREPWQ